METIKIPKGETLELDLEWEVEGELVDLTGKLLSIIEANPHRLRRTGTRFFSLVPGGAIARLTIPAENMAAAGLGPVNWVRLAIADPGGRVYASPKIRIDVQ